MRKLTPVELAPWTLPLIVLAVMVPIIGAVLLAGPAAGFIAGAAVATTIIVLAARARYEEPIEVASATDQAYHLLVVITAPADDPRAVEAIATAATEGSRRASPWPQSGSEVLVVAPALNRRLSHWMSDLRQARMRAQERLAVSLAALAAAEVEATGRVGDTDPVQAAEDTLASFPAQEVIFVTAEDEGGEEVAEVRKRLDRRLTHLVAGGSAPAPDPPPTPGSAGER